MAECNAAKTLDNAVLEGYDTDVMTGDRDKRRYLYYQLIHSMRKADRIDIIVSFFDGIRCENAFGRTEKGYEARSEGPHSDWKLSWHYAAIGLVSDQA